MRTAETKYFSLFIRGQNAKNGSNHEKNNDTNLSL